MVRVTVLMTVKNVEKYIQECLISILTQTYQDFELLIFNDASVDKTMDIISLFKDSRIRIITQTSGYINNLNIGLQIAQGTYIARMDGDDIMFPQRLEKQVKVMDEQNADVCGSWVLEFGEQMTSKIVTQSGKGWNNNMLQQLVYNNILTNPSTMLRREFLQFHQLQYEHEFFRTEDYKLWFEILKCRGTFFIIDEPLLAYRRSNEQVTIVHSEEMIRQILTLQSEIEKYLEIKS